MACSAMKNFDLNTSAGEWFPFFESDIQPNGDIKYLDPEKDAAKVKLRMADPDVLDIIQKETGGKREVEHVLNPKTRKMERIEFYTQTPDQKKREREMTWDHAIMDWEDKPPFLNNDQSPIARTAENKLKLMAIPVFGRFVGRCMELLSGTGTDIKEVAEKNS